MLSSQVLCIAHVLCWLSAMAGSVAVQSYNFRRAASGRLPGVASAAILKRVRSSLDCGRQCQPALSPACCSYGYSQASKECHLFSNSHLGGFKSATGFHYFLRCPVAVGDSCQKNADCISTANAECRGGTCQCVAGYHFYPGPGTCVATCPGGYGEGYYSVEDRHLTHYHIGDCEPQWSEQDCWLRCRADDRCRSFEYNGDECCIFSETALSARDVYTYSEGCTYYQRNCA